MLKADALILLINSLTKSEKKSFKTGSKSSDYLDLFDIIEKSKGITAEELRKQFSEIKPKSNFDITCSYLYKLLLDTLLSLHEKQDNVTAMMNQLLKARILFDKLLFEEAIDQLNQVKEKAIIFENEYIFLYASRLELEFLLFLNFPYISETTLLKKHLKINESLKRIRRINEQSVLYELIKHRVLYKDNIRSKIQKDTFNDLVVSEMSLVASSNVNSFEIKKLHQLFQSTYLLSVGDYKSALHSYYELNNLFEENKHLWANPPIYYLTVLEGILDSLRGIKEYNSIPFFLEKLEALNNKSNGSVNFQANTSALIFLYKLFPLLDRGDFQSSKDLMEEYKENVIEKVHLLSLNRQAEISLYVSLIYFGLRDYKQAQKSILKVITQSKSFYYLPLYRTIRLVNLMIQYEIGHLNDFEHEIRSIKREISKIKKAYKVEHMMLNTLSKLAKGIFFYQREKEWLKIQPDIQVIQNDVFEMQMLKLFNFLAWIESKIRNIPFSKILQNQNSEDILNNKQLLKVNI